MSTPYRQETVSKKPRSYYIEKFSKWGEKNPEMVKWFMNDPSDEQRASVFHRLFLRDAVLNTDNFPPTNKDLIDAFKGIKLK